jgi:hypothetical protein
MVDPEKQAAAAFFSVLETPQGESEGYFPRIMAVLGGLLGGLD